MITTDLTNLITPSRDKSGGFIGKGNTSYGSTIAAAYLPQLQGYTPKVPLYYNGSNLFVFGRNGILMYLNEDDGYVERILNASPSPSGTELTKNYPTLQGSGGGYLLVC